MKSIQRSLRLIALVVLVLSCCACSAGRGDWKYELPNGYYVFMSHSNSVAIVGDEYRNVGNGMTRNYIESHVTAFCYDNRYVAARQQASADTSTENVPPTTISYYLLDTQTALVYGPYDVEAYEEKLLEFDDIELCEWISTAAAPEAALINGKTVS